MSKAFALVAALALSGCTTVAPAPLAASVTMPASFALTSSERASIGAIADLLPRNDAAFIALEQHALINAPTLAIALARIDAARAGVDAAGAARLPELNSSAGVSRNEGNAASTGVPAGLGIATGRTSYTAGVAASWDADLFGRLRASQRAATARLDAAGADAAAVRLALITDIAQAVIEARMLDARAAIIRQDLMSANDLVTLTGVRARAGIAPGFDLVRAQSLEADAQARLAPIAADQAGVIGRLVRLTALPTAEVQAMLALPRSGADAVAARPAITIPSILLRRRPDVAAAEYRLAAADADIAAAAAARFPRLSITATLGLVALAFGDLFNADALVGSLGAGVAGPILDFGRINAQIDARQADARVAFETYRGTVFQALGESEAALGAIDARDARVAALERQALLDTDTVALARERYRRGLETFLTVIDAERSANLSRSAVAIAHGDAAATRVALYRAVGGVPVNE